MKKAQLIERNVIQAQRIVALERTVAALDKTCDDYSKAVAESQANFDRVERVCRKLSDQLGLAIGSINADAAAFTDFAKTLRAATPVAEQAADQL